jgi:multidrug efflux pump subunit AcrA (membrane-fusion protein)
VRPGIPVLDIIDASAMQVRAKLNQADVGLVAVGQAATVRLDAYPGLVFTGRVESVAPLATTSSLTQTVRTFVTVVSIKGTDPQLMPDLTASVEIAVPADAGATPLSGGRGGC